MNEWAAGPEAVVSAVLATYGFGFATSTRAAGDMHLDGGDAARAARNLFTRQHGGGLPLVCGRQVHEASIVTVASSSAIVHDATDGIIVPAGIPVTAGAFTADCLAIGIFDLRRGDFALVHSGWKGTALGIAGLALDRLLGNGSRVEDLHVAFSPSIKICCYEVGDEFARMFPDGPFERIKDRLHFDNEGRVASDLERRGIPRAQIHRNPACTFCDPARRFHSHRRDKASAGRMLTLAWRMPTFSAGVNG